MKPKEMSVPVREAIVRFNLFCFQSVRVIEKTLGVAEVLMWCILKKEDCNDQLRIPRGLKDHRGQLKWIIIEVFLWLKPLLYFLRPWVWESPRDLGKFHHQKMSARVRVCILPVFCDWVSSCLCLYSQWIIIKAYEKQLLAKSRTLLRNRCII